MKKKLLLIARIILAIVFLPLSLLMLPAAWIFISLVRKHRHLWRSYLQAAVKLRKRRVMGFPPPILLAFEQKDEWSRVMPWIQKIKSEKKQMEVAGGFATLYLWNERITEARQATDYWMKVSAEWVREHPVEAITAAQTYQKSAMWYPYGFTDLFPAEVLERDSSLSFMRSEIKIHSQALQLDQGIVTEWRDARLVNEFVDWVAGKSLTGEAIGNSLPRKEQTAPFTIGYDSVHFPRFFVAWAGIPRSEFKRMWRRAASLDEM